MALLLQLRLGCRGREARRWNSYARNHAPMLLTFVFIASLCLRMIQNCFHCWNPGWTVNSICLPLFPNDRRALSLMSARFLVRPRTVQTKNLSHRNHLYAQLRSISHAHLNLVHCHAFLSFSPAGLEIPRVTCSRLFDSI